MKDFYKFFWGLLFIAVTARGANMSIDSLSGPVTANEINSFITYMNTQTPPQTPWGTLGGTGHNAWADGTGGRELEAMGEMFIVSSNMTILNQMVSWSDYCTSQRNDLMSVTNGGQRVLWTGLIDKVWVPNWPTDGTDGQSNYCGCESEDTIGHIAFCAKLILQTPAIWNTVVPDGNPYSYGATYFQRATNYLAKCDEANDEYFLKWFIQPSSNLIVPPTNAAWVALNENVTANNRQMMFTSGFQRLAEAHEILGDNPARVAQYDAIVKATLNQDLTGMVNYDQYTKNGQTVYNWGYYPTSDAPEATEIHAEYDIIGIWRAFNRVSYGYTLSPLIPFGNTMVNVIYLGTNTFAGSVNGSGGTQSPVYSGWIFPADWNPQVYTCVAGVAYTNGWYKSSADIEAGILFMKNRRYLEFSVTPSPATKIVQAGAQANYALAVAPLGGFTNTVSLAVNNLPSGATATFTNGTVNCGTLPLSSTNSTLSIQTSVSTPVGNYNLAIVSTSGSVSHTNFVNLVVGNYSVSANPSSQTVSPGGNTSYTVGVATNSGFSGSVSFGLSGLPANCSASFNPASVSGANSSALNVIASNSAVAGNYTLTIYGTNGATVASATATLQITGGATPIWNGGSSAGNYWNDSANWGGISLSANGPLTFGGTARLNNTNNTTAGTTYSNIIFNSGAGTFSLNGNSIALTGNITNDSANPQAINFGINFGGSVTFNGASNDLFVLGGLTNTAGAPGASVITLAGSGELSDLWKSANTPGGTNIITVNDPLANWSIVHNPNASGTAVPWVFQVTNGVINFGTEASAPTVTSITPHNSPADNQVGAIAGATGVFNFVNGTLTTSSRFNTALAANSTGIINITGGTLNMGEQFQGANGGSAGEVSQINVSGGALNISGGTGPCFVASRGTGTLTVSDSGVLNCATLDVSRNADGNIFSSIGEVDLDGGTLEVTSVTNASANAQTGGTPQATFYFNGGTLMAKSGAKTMFFQGSLVTPVCPITTIVQLGGAVIDDGGQTITIGEPLQHDSTLGAVLDGGLTKLDSGTLNLITTNSYNGETLVDGGTLALNGGASISNSTAISVSSGATLDASVHNGGALTIANGQTLTGSGTVNGNITIASGATLAPGGSLSTLTFNNNLTLNGGSATLVEISDTPTTNDAAQVAGNLILNGTLVVTNAGSNSLSAGDSFKLFNAANFSGAFTNIQPIVPQPGLKWDTSALTNGVLKIVAAPLPVIANVSLSGTNLIFNGTNGQPGENYLVLSSTNLAMPLEDWAIIATNAFDTAGNFSVTNQALLSQTFYILQLQ